MTPLLSILIPSTHDRDADAFELMAEVARQLDENYSEFEHSADGVNYRLVQFESVEVLIVTDDKTMTIGQKRELMYSMATGLFAWQIDSDDWIADNGICLILEAIKSNPEVSCITFRERCMMNGEYKTCNHSIQYSQWMDNSDGYDYIRSPFYKDVIRTDIAKSVPFEHIRYNEDERFSYALYPHLKDEIHIDQELYYYNYEPKDSHEERYGLNK